MSNDVKGGWTPGPWAVETLGTKSPTHYIGSTKRDGGVDEIACAIEDDISYKPEARARRAANAHLIASAPELFEALQVLLEFDGISAREKARAALAKATGGTPTP